MGGPGGRPRWEAEGVVPYLKIKDWGIWKFNISCRQGKDIGFREEGKWKMYPRLNWSESVYQAE